MTAFDTAWDLTKDFYFDSRDEMTGGKYTGPTATANVTVPDFVKRPTGFFSRFTAGKRDWDPYYGAELIQEDGNPTSENTVITGDAAQTFDPSKKVQGAGGISYRTDLNPYTEQEQIDRGRDATPETAEFRRGGSLPRTKTMRTDTPRKTIIDYKDAKGQDIEGYDKSGKRYLQSNINQLYQFEGQDRDYATHTGTNLSTYGPANRYRNLFSSAGFDEDEAIDDIISTIVHESGHEAIDEELVQAVNQGILPNENFNAAHEVGAHTLQHFADEDKVNERLARHTNTAAHSYKAPKQFQTREGGKQIRMPKPRVIKSFDDVWDLMKAPFHGTTTGVLERIREQGLQPKAPDAFTKPSVFFSQSPEQAIGFANIRSDLTRGKDGGDPVLLHFPLDAVKNPNRRLFPPEGDNQWTESPIPASAITEYYGPPKPQDEEKWDEWQDAIISWRKEMMERYERGEFDD
tara:strand:- start:23210 stop:24592 length:1383 start_codon:yes stop_codon:yes gene_type:complete